jgi:hypothetical protein
MSEDNKDKLAEAAGIGAMGCMTLVYLGIPVLLFITLLMAVVRGCSRMFS